jgi:hypothetical protein
MACFLLDVLLGGASAVVELDRALVGSGKVDHDEAEQWGSNYKTPAAKSGR